jgi:hypothetical protein
MSRTVTPPAAQHTATPKVTHEKIAMRAYEKWVHRGCVHGTDQQDWLEAEAELQAEMNRGASHATARPAVAPAKSAAPAPQAARRH